jgi:aryl-alcohol dehydrogenase-like predicted oxidoreductase
LTTESLRKCLEYGINFIDTAEGYGHGVAEIMLGNSIKELGLKREDLVISTKIFFFGGGDEHINVNFKGLSRKHIIEGLKNCLKRLQLTYVDVVFAHRPDFDTPLEETCRAFSWLIDHGLAFYWGTSEWSASRISEAVELCKRFGLHAPIVEQPQYSMLQREKFEKEYRPLFERLGYGTTTWSPLAGGLLSGKYNDGNVPADSRFGTSAFHADLVLPKYFGPTKKEATLKTLNGLAEIAKELGCT